ncbi:hypothetical protein NM688_g4909 [Phlebia brevispora]|uniref:Uncharacterized protein n=1 Tax=Phlebia brevispora TaxID=194682 RepID=A0ACC1T1A8_9APHY|nr:hypothetical protein NM688_g4909 [Phlebia brevispora]
MSALTLILAAFGICGVTAGLPPYSIDVILGNATAGPISPLNDTVFDWWYWDAVSDDLNASAVLTVFTAEPSGLWAGIPVTGSATWFGGMFTFPNGTPWEVFLPANKLTVITVDDGSSGLFDGINAAWVGLPDMSTYVLTVDEPDAGIQGTFTLRSTAPAHLPCSADVDVSGQSFAISPDFGWANAVPDADSLVNFTLGGTKLQFSGPGYHDKNWGCKPTNVTVKSWYWGHARVGPYSIVWFTVIAPDGSEYVSNYAAKGGEVVTASCGGLTVRPTGANATYPPTPTSPAPEGFHIEQDIEGEGTLVVDVQNIRLITYVPDTAYRWFGNVTGGFGNGTQWTGAALYEAFAFAI